MMHQTDIRHVGLIIILGNLWYFDFAIHNGETSKITRVPGFSMHQYEWVD